MIAVLAIGLVVLVVLAAVVGIVDATQAGTWRGIARERRADWEQRRRDAQPVDDPEPVPGHLILHCELPAAGRLQRPAAGEGPAERQLVGELEVAAHRQP